MGIKRPENASMLLVREYFDQQDDRFVEELRKVYEAPSLGALADQWKTDRRPWAREQIFYYLSHPLDRPGHNVVVKRLFKHAEKTGDDALMAVFLNLFDGLIRRERRTRYFWDGRNAQSYQVLVAPRNGLTPGAVFEYTSWDGKKHVYLRQSAGDRLFSNRTRYYLRRRTWRYFRHLGFQRPQDYVKAVCRALVRYRDEELEQGENILDSWGLVHICFQYHDALDIGPTTINLKEGRSLAELSPAPRFLELWQEPAAFDELFTLVQEANCRLVRVWAMEMLRREHKPRFAELSADDILKLLDHRHEEVVQFGAEVLEQSAGLETLPLDVWLKLTETKNVMALEIICDAMAQHVTSDRLSLEKCVQLACNKATPVARMGMKFLKHRSIHTADQRRTLAGAAHAECSAVGEELAQWALGILGHDEVYDRDVVLEFFDSLLPEIRRAAWAWLTPERTAYNDPGLWSRLLETPFDEVRLQLVDALEARSRLPGADANDLTPLWSSVLLGVHRGGRHKSKALRQVSDALMQKPERAETLLPVLAVAVRSIRGPEFRGGLAAVVAAVQARPELEQEVSKHFPEVKLTAEVTA